VTPLACLFSIQSPQKPTTDHRGSLVDKQQWKEWVKWCKWWSTANGYTGNSTVFRVSSWKS